MNVMALPWLQMTILLPLLGALRAGWQRDSDIARRHTLVACSLALIAAVGGWINFALVDGPVAVDRWDLGEVVSGGALFSIDALSAPLVPVGAMFYLLVALATPRTKLRLMSFGWLLISEAILLATISSQQPAMIVVLLAVGTIPPWVGLFSQGCSTRVLSIHMLLFVALLVAGQALVGWSESANLRLVGVLLLTMAVLLRAGIVPLHGWMADLCEFGSFSNSLVFLVPMASAYAAMRLVLPVAPDWVLRGITIISLITALYAACLALVQRDARRFYCYLFLSNSSLVFVGLETATPVALTGALCLWISVILALGGYGLTLRAIEHRVGRLELDRFYGLYQQTPGLAALFLLTGLASIGFPGTIGFIGVELLVDGAVQVHSLFGILIVLAATLNGLAILHAYFRVFTGARRGGTIDLQVRLPERVAVLVLTVLILGGGLFPQPGVQSRYAAAAELVKQRARLASGAGTAARPESAPSLAARRGKPVAPHSPKSSR
ncbi:MAG: oxidoreductase [Pirellulales bacterium]|nr:oxidoreductase [Pirellulales bacterium]